MSEKPLMDSVYILLTNLQKTYTEIPIEELVAKMKEELGIETPRAEEIINHMKWKEGMIFEPRPGFLKVL